MSLIYSITEIDEEIAFYRCELLPTYLFISG